MAKSRVAEENSRENMMIVSHKSNKLYFWGEKARYWAETMVNPVGLSAADYCLQQIEIRDVEMLVFHPEDEIDREKIPSDFEGVVVKWPTNVGTSYAN